MNRFFLFLIMLSVLITTVLIVLWYYYEDKIRVFFAKMIKQKIDEEKTTNETIKKVFKDK